jgi:multicomponent Na+:H+ antiporter subunit G
VIEIFVAVLILSGTLLSLLSSFGIIRLPDVYTRAHATTKSATLGILSILLGAFLYFLYMHGVASIRLLLGIAFVFLTAPVGGHLIIRSAHRSKVKLADISVQDDLEKHLRYVSVEQAGADSADAAAERQQGS